MANSFTNITDKILARGLTVLREAAIMPRLVNVDFNNEAASKGSTIDVPKSVSQTVADVSAGAANITPASKTPGLIQVSMSNWKKTDFFMTDKEMLEVDRNQHFVPHQTEEAARALANDIDTAITTSTRASTASSAPPAPCRSRRSRPRPTPARC